MSTTTPWIKTNIVVWGECVAGRGCKVQDRTNRSELKVTDLFNAGKTSVNKQLTNQGGSCQQHIHRGDEAKWTHLGNRIWQDRGSKTEHHTHRQETFKIKQEITYVEPQTETLELDLGAVSQYSSPYLCSCYFALHKFTQESGLPETGERSTWVCLSAFDDIATQWFYYY